MEIRTIGQQYTVLIDGELINQFDNSVPKIASRNGDPPTMARQLAEGYLGLQTHGGNDRISYREIQVKDISADEIPVNVEPPAVGGPGRVGKPLTCGRGEWENTPDADYWVTWYRSNPVGPEHPRYRAPEPARPRELHHPGRARVRHPEPDLARLAGRRPGHEVHAHRG